VSTEVLKCSGLQFVIVQEFDYEPLFLEQSRNVCWCGCSRHVCYILNSENGSQILLINIHCMAPYVPLIYHSDCSVESICISTGKGPV